VPSRPGFSLERAFERLELLNGKPGMDAEKMLSPATVSATLKEELSVTH